MSTVSKQKLRQILDLMKDGNARTAKETAAEICISAGEANRAFQMLYDGKSVHIADWYVPQRGGLSAVYSIGAGSDKGRPISKDSRMVRQRKDVSKKKRQSYEARERMKLALEAADRARKASEIKPFRDPLIAAFYGEYRRDACPTI